MKNYATVVEVIKTKTAANITPEDIKVVYDGKDGKVFAAQVAAMTILCNVLPDGSYKVTTVIW